MISDSAKTPEVDTLAVKLDAVLNSAIQGTDVAIGSLKGYRGMDALVAMAGVDFEGGKWSVAALIDNNEAGASMVTMRNTILGLSLLLLLGAMALSIWFSRTLTKPIEALVDNMRRLAGGDTSIDLAGEDRKDEIGEMARSVAVFRDAAIEKVDLERRADESRSLSERERQQNESARAEEALRMQQAVDALAGGLHQLAEGDLSIRLQTPFMQSLDSLRLDFLEAGHFTFSDACTIAPAAVMNDGCGPDFLDNTTAHRLINAYALAFLRLHLLGDAQDLDLLAGG